MMFKQILGRRSVAAVVKVAERADVAWTAMMVVNTAFVWSAGAMSIFGLMPAAANNTAVMAIAPAGMVAPSAPVELPREPLEVMPGFEAHATQGALQRTVEPAQAVWGYLCNRDVLVSEAADRPCSRVTFAKSDLLTLGPLKRNEGDAVYGRQQATIETLIEEQNQ